MKKIIAGALAAALFCFTANVEAKLATKCTRQNIDSSTCCGTQYGYFYLTCPQCLKGWCFDPISWAEADSLSSSDIYINSSCPTEIILKKAGTYLVHYILTGEAVQNPPPPGMLVNNTHPESDCQGFQFALYLNNANCPIPGSTYATDSNNSQLYQKKLHGGNCGCEGCDTQLSGQVVFTVESNNSTIKLVNQSESKVGLDSGVGTKDPEKFGPNVAASIYITKLCGL